MKKLLLCILCLGLSYSWAQDDVTGASLAGMLEQNQGQIIALAEAFSEKQMDWRPAEGIRSVGETILHTAAANYYIASKMGHAPPEGVDMMNMEKITGKENIINTFKASAEFIRGKIAMVDAATYGDEIDLGFAKLNTFSTLLVILEHNGEHKGQLIAYARSNGVTPPWSQAQQ